MRSSVSAIIPAYNYARYLPAAIDSVLAQDYPSALLEIVVVDDGSTDETPEVLERYGDAIRVIRQPNGGVCAATSTGIGAATGELMAFLGADDTWPRDRVKRLVRALETNPRASLAYGDMAIVDSEDRLIEPTFAGVHRRRSGDLLGTLLDQNFISGGALMIRAAHRELYHPIPEFMSYEDWWLACRAASVGPLVYVDAVVNRYRSHGENMNLGADRDKGLALKLSTMPFRRWLLENVDHTQVTPDQLATALDTFDQHVAVLQFRDPVGLAEAVDADRAGALSALGAASDALDRGEHREAFAWLVRSAVRDQNFGEPRNLLAQLLPMLSGTGAVVAA
jgi:glycosyltransferase involved in cell wall biosynthesis